MARRKKSTKSVAKAEERAYNGENETQDSQIIFDQMQAAYGIGQLSSSPAPDNRPRDQNHHRNLLGSAVVRPKHQTTPAVNASNISASRPQPPPINRTTVIATEAHYRSEQSSSGTTATGFNTVANDHASLPNFRPTTALKKKKMEDGTQSPTQSNDGRSYEQYREPRSDGFPSSQLKPTDSGDHYESQRSHADTDHEHATLHGDETGAVNFDLAQFERDAAGDAHILNDADTESGSEDEREGYSSVPPIPHRRTSSGVLPPTFARNSSTGMPPPQTPALATRLFHAGGTAEPLMPSSQLFANTQFTSAVKKVASPTSSRPSPEINQNTISPNPRLASSPLRGLRTSPIRTSSPYAAPPSSIPIPKDQDTYETPESPRGKPFRIRSVPEPIRDYIPSRSSPVERHTSVEILDESGAGHSDSDRERELRKRQRRAKRKQEQATRSLMSIPISRPSSRSEELIEVPSTNRRKLGSRSAGQLAYASNEDAQETVADSQDAGTKVTEASKDTPLHEKEAPGVAAHEPGFSSSDIPLLPRANTFNFNGSSRDLIPETSPACTATEPKGPSPSTLSNEPTQAVSTPTLPPPKRLKRFHAEEPDETVMSDPGDQSKPIRSSPPMPSTAPAPISQPSQRQSDRLQETATPQPVPSSSAAHLADPGTSSSSLTALSVTPNVSSSTTPNTEEGEEAPKNNSSSPAAAKVQRQSRPRSSLKTYSPVPQRAPRDRARKEPGRLARHSSVSTDELARPSPSPASIAGQTRGARSFRSVKDTSLQFPSGMFSGMVFVTTIGSSENDRKKKTEAQRREEAEKEDKKEKVESLIRKGGGQIMNAGFHDLFEEKSSIVPETSARMLASCLRLTSEAASAGFTALITDNCSRKAKYMQALALGLPCLSWNWITACHAKGSMVDWLPYMLCAGPSTVLDGAFKSRDLPKYEASDARLSRTISERPKLLDEMSVLLVVKKTPKHEKKCTLYAFLVHVLGANLERVTTPSEAGHILREREATGRPFDWVYPDGDNAVFNVLTGGPPTQANNTKKRKRQSTTNSGSFATPLQSMPRILTDELIVQSLILGRLVEEGEM